MFTPIPEALDAFKRGEFLVVLDDENRENEGDLIIAGQNITTAQMAFLVRYSSGYVCAPVSNEVADRLDLPLMTSMQSQRGRSDAHNTAYTITVDALEGTTTGISAHDRALTARKLAEKTARPTDFSKPGHLVPLRAVDGGILARRGHTEAAVELCKLTGQSPVGVICEIVRDEDGLMARRDDCEKLAAQHGIKMITIDALVDYVQSKTTNGK